MPEEPSISQKIPNWRQWYLDMIHDLGLRQGDLFDICEIMDWFGVNIFPDKTYKDYRRTVGKTLPVFTVNDPRRWEGTSLDDDLFFMNSERWYRLYEKDSDPLPVRSSDIIKNASRFPNENALRDYLAKNLNTIEPGLRLYHSGGISGIEYQAGNGRIDILALDKDSNFVVIELKLSSSNYAASGQLITYMGWIKDNLAPADSRVRGIIIGHEVSSQLYLSTSLVQNVKLFTYKLSVKIERVVDPRVIS
jgi:hypothetical protein